RRALNWIMGRKWIAVAAILACFAAIFALGSGLKSELAPLEDRSRFRLAFNAPEGTAYDAMDNYVNQVTQYIIDSVPEKETILTVTAPGFSGAGAVNSGFGNIRLSLPNERARTQNEIVQSLNKDFRNFNFGQVF